MKRAMLALALVVLVACAGQKRPDPPVFEPLPAVTFHQGADGSICLDQENAQALSARERLRDLREAALVAWGQAK